MRTIVITGNPTPAKDITIYSPSEYTYVFSPNVIRVTLGSGFAVDEEVTLVGAGITFKARCKARVCYFDMSAMFRAKFAESNFSYGYTINQPDPFFQTIEVTIGADAESDVFDYALRWGARQMDEGERPDTVTFPYWPTMPLMVNIDTYYNNWYSPTFETSGDIELIYIDTETANTTFEINAYYNMTTEQVLTFIPRTCPANGRYLRWVDGHGKLFHFMFYPSRREGIRTESATGDKIHRYPVDYTDSETGALSIISKSKKRSFTCFASEETAIFEVLQSIAASPLVHWWVSNR